MTDPNSQDREPELTEPRAEPPPPPPEPAPAVTEKTSALSFLRGVLPTSGPPPKTNPPTSNPLHSALFRLNF